MSTTHYSLKSEDYFSNVRRDIVSLLPRDPAQKVLEVGAGSGSTLLYIKEQRLAAEVMGVELIKLPGSNQEHPLIDKFQIANIEEEEIAAAQAYFDVILCPDVLEHLADPWAAVEKISRYLRRDGLLIVSIPNLREWKTLASIVFKGEFNYRTEGGIMDKTHLRFFCKKNILRLLSTPGLSPIFCRPNFMLREVPAGKKRRIFNRLTFRLLEDFLTVQYLVIARKK
jgi:2-polyprenyl-3-methyl-5-hydroxy-6-metoxy-1,4-benzoquinol methylase